MTIQELERIMKKHGAVIRAIPETIHGVYKKRHADQFPNAHIEYLEEYKREMLVDTRVPEHAGKFIITTENHTCETVRFYKDKIQYYDTIEEAVQSLIGEEEKPMNIKERIKQIAADYQNFSPQEYIGSIPTKTIELTSTVLDRFVHEVNDLMHDNLYDNLYGEEYDIQLVGMSRINNPYESSHFDAYFTIAWVEKDEEENPELQMCPIKLRSASWQTKQTTEFVDCL